MAQDSDSIVVAGNGSVFVAPVGTSLPVDVATALPAAWVDLGYINEDGATFNDSKTTEEIQVWQSFYAPRRVVTERSATVAFTLRQWDRLTVPLAFGGGEITTVAGPPAVYRYDPPDPEVIDERATVLEWLDGGSTYRIVLPRVMVSEGVETQLVRTAASDLPITLGILGTAGVKPWSLLTSDPAFAAS